jgi:TonB-linked SusC/RagA family outer membrane protein
MKRLLKSTKMKGAIFALLLAFSLSVSAQTQVRGTVIDEYGDPAIGATVQVKGTTQGTVTDIDGNFTISAPVGGTLVVSYVGYRTQEVPVSANVKVELRSDATLLHEVVIQVPYGTTRRASFTGAADVVGANAIRDVPAMSFETALQGIAPGVSIRNSSGQPGSQQQIILRGHGSVNASIQPLYVIDGVPIAPENLSISGVTGSAGSLGISSLIATSDIESITVLKDAAATAMFGSRGGNGVIMITTKNGRAGRTTVQLRTSVGFSNWAVNNRPNLSGDQIRELWHEGVYNNRIDAGLTPDAAKTFADNYTNDRFSRPEGGWSDWASELFRDRGTTQNYEASVSGGNDKTQFFTSLSYRNEEGMSMNSWAKQYTGRLNLLHEFGRIKMGTNLSISKLDKNRVAEGFAYANPYYMSRSYLWPSMPIYNEDGSYYEGPLLNGEDNLVKLQNLDQYLLSVYSSRASTWAEWSIMDNLRLRQTFNYDYTNTNSKTVWPSNSGNGDVHGGLIIRINPLQERLYSSTILSYDKSFGEHNLDALVGWDAEKRMDGSLQATGAGFGSPYIHELAGASEPRTAWSISDNDRMLSFLSRVNYNYANKYYASASFRRDASSRFGANNRWGTFWSTSGAWRVTGEDFMENATDVLRDLRIRASIGETGNLPANWYESQSTFGVTGSYRGQPVSFMSRISNPDLSWEKVLSWNVGIDANLWNKLHLELDYYIRDTKDLIASVPTPQSSGFSNFTANMGSLRNEGFELSLGYNVVQTRDFMWFSRLNLAANKNTVTEVYGGMEEVNRGNFMTRKGHSFWSLWSREFAGINTETGAEQWYTNTTLPDGSIEREITENPANANRIIIGNADPKWTGGWTNTFTYKGFELSTLFTFTQGGRFMDDGWTRNAGGRFDFSILPKKEEYDRWQKPGDQTQTGRRVFGYQYGNFGSSKWIYSSDHIRLKNLTLAYNLPRNIVQKVDMSGVRFTFTGTNLLTFAKTPGFDPEIPSGYLVGYEFPALKEFVFGVEVSF